MSGSQNDPDSTGTTPLGIYDRPKGKLITGFEIAAIALSAIWLGASLIFGLSGSGDGGGATDGLGLLPTLITVLLPIGMIWVCAIVLRSKLAMREEIQRLQLAIDGLRQAYVNQAQRGQAISEPAMTKRLDELAATARKTEATLASITAQRAQPAPAEIEAPAAQVPATEQGSLALDAPADTAAAPLSIQDFVRALNFPENAADKAGFDAMRRALRDRKAAQLIQASQDVLTLLSQEGIYTDDLRPDMARPEVWRQFAQGTRGREVAALGGVHDKDLLALTADRMKQDPIFRDAAHHFLRLFDRMFAVFEAHADDAEISALGDTRTARAFMLLGRVAGTFD